MYRFERAADDLLPGSLGMDLPAPEGDRRLCCRACGAFITRAAERTAVGGAHEHYCTNPHGVSFRVACFSLAPGCRALGPATVDHSWFAGFAWQLAVCAACGQHLGWRFRNRAGEGFFGLIRDRLVENAADPPPGF